MVRETLAWGQTALRIHLDRLVEMEYVKLQRGGRGSTMVYELLWDGRGREGEPTLCGLIDVTKLAGQAKNLSGQVDDLARQVGNLARQEANLAGSKRPENAHLAQGENNGKAKQGKD